MAERPPYFLRITVTAIERAPKRDPVIRFDAHTNLPNFRTTQFRDVRRTHHELEKLCDHLIHENAECIVPALYPNVTSYGAGTEEDERTLKYNMQHWLDLVCSNPILIRDPELVHFVESDVGWSPMHSRGKPFSGPKRRAIKQFAPPPDDTAELVDARPIAKGVYLLASDVHSKLNRESKARRSLALSETDLGYRLSTLPGFESQPGMANALAKLGRVMQSVSDARTAQATVEVATLGDAVQHVADDAYVVKETLTTRQIVTRDYNQAQNATRSKTASTGRMKSTSSISSSKVDEALLSLEEAKALEQALAAKLARVTSNLLLENRLWKQRTSIELKAALKTYARKQIDSERRVLAVLESVRPDIRNIDASGGLSRLGRERVDRQGSYLGPSQTQDGDSWSGIKRSNSTRSAAAASVLVHQPPPIAVDSPGGLGNLQAGVRGQETDKVDARNAASILAAS
ncbi:Vacuolar protein sorting-associated protein 17 [Savitreella phatthalungensis]